MYSNSLKVMMLESLLNREYKDIKVNNYETYLKDLLSILETKEEKKYGEMPINESVALVANYLKDPYNWIYRETLLTVMKFGQTDRGYFSYNQSTGFREIGIPILNTVEDAYTMIHELMHYLNSFPDIFRQSRDLLSEGISMSAETLLAKSINDDNKEIIDTNRTIKKLKHCINFLEVLKIYEENRIVILPEMIKATNEDFINKIILSNTSSFLDNMLYINGYVLTKIIDDYEKLQYVNEQVSYNKAPNEILNNLGYETDNYIIKKRN